MSTEQNKAVVRRFIEEILNKQNAALVDDLFAPDYVNHMMPGDAKASNSSYPCCARPTLISRWSLTSSG
jgi:hypothetical protein